MFGLGGKKTPTLVVHHLNESRSQRVLWLLEAATRLAPPELKAVHPLGKSPVITDKGRTINESAAILDYLARKYGKGRFRPAYDTPAHDDYSMWLHYAESSAMLPLMLRLYVRRLGDAVGQAAQPLALQRIFGADRRHRPGARQRIFGRSDRRKLRHALSRLPSSFRRA